MSTIQSPQALAGPRSGPGRRLRRFRPSRRSWPPSGPCARAPCHRADRVAAGCSAGSTFGVPTRSPTTRSSKPHRQRRPATGLRPDHPFASWMRTTGSAKGRSLRSSIRSPTATRSTSRWRTGFGPGRAGPPACRPRPRPQRGTDPDRDCPAHVRRGRLHRGKAEESLKYTRDEVEKGIDEARAGVKAAQASLTLAELEYARFTRLEQQGASTRQRRQQVTQSRDSASAQVDVAAAKLAKALARAPRSTSPAGRSRLLRSRNRRRPRASTSRRSATTRFTRSNCWSRSRNGRSSRPSAGWRPPRTTWRIPGSGPHFPALWSSAIGIWAIAHRRARLLLSLYNPDLLYMEANLEEDRLPGVAPGNPVDINIDAFAEPFRGRVLWINKSTGSAVR